MRIGVGSTNPVKRAAVQQVITSDEDGFATGASVEAVSVPSGVSEQPTGHEETRHGAITRATRVLEASAYDLGVGIEGGVARFPGSEDQFLVMWASVTDGDRTSVASGPSLPLPAAIADRINSGEELGPVMDDVLGTNEIAKKQGAAGAFTSGRIDRTQALAHAVSGAIGPFVCSLYDHPTQ